MRSAPLGAWSRVTSITNGPRDVSKFTRNVAGAVSFAGACAAACFEPEHATRVSAIDATTENLFILLKKLPFLKM